MSSENQIHDAEEEEEERRPLIDSSILTLTVHENELPPVSVPNQRLVSLDVFRGLTVALMILVDDVGRAFPSLNHSPWFGVTLADFVMPFFLFGVGVSIALVFKKVSSKQNATKKIISRTIKLFLLGLLLQGGYFHGRGNLTYGLDLTKLRWFGVLQRISIGYFLASMSEIWLVNGNILVDSPAAFVRKYSIQWIFSILLCSVYLCLLYGLYVPNWEFEHSNLLWPGRVSTIQNVSWHGFVSVSLSTEGIFMLSEIPSLSTEGIDGVNMQFGFLLLIVPAGTLVHCDMRGSLDPPCNAVGFIDRLILGEDHMYQRPVYRRTKECSVNSPDYGPLPPDSPGWCLAPFDPEGILSSLMAAITCFVGLQFGHILVIFQAHKQRVLLWSVFSFSLLVVGYVLEILGIPLSKALYTLSFMFITAGASGLVLTAIYYIVDIKQLRKPTVLLQWMGMNALIVYALAACDIFPAVIQGFYWRSPENNLVDASEALIQNILHSEKWGTLAFVIIEILFWGLLAGFLHKKGIYIKL
ncbi:heparan-alpha-glucosaminide N-acetyltransferase-like protein [Medicago truncatula]|uniref:Heparan-alpha-glucosaminide N-acetyltransferase-like protein n=1 Tax=Medicago truncatula TaxID=3880 RepID=A0A072VNJ3_MEDTR|nr:heparan-alpha-glucosaminide N-acetyltransferase-like protein [Medicago truncatula]